MAQLPDGSVLVCDSGHNRIRLLGADGSVSVFAGSGRKGMSDGPSVGASFNSPSGLCVCADGTVLVADTGNDAVRAIAPTASAREKRMVSTLAGCGSSGCTDGPAVSAKFNKPTAVLALGAPSGLTDGESVVYVADSNNHCIRTISTGPRNGELLVGTLCGTPGVAGHADGAFASALLSTPTGLAVLSDGTLAVSDSSSNTLRRVHFASHKVSTLAGSGDRGWGLVDGGPPLNVEMS